MFSYDCTINHLYLISKSKLWIRVVHHVWSTLVLCHNSLYTQIEQFNEQLSWPFKNFPFFVASLSYIISNQVNFWFTHKPTLTKSKYTTKLNTAYSHCMIVSFLYPWTSFSSKSLLDITVDRNSMNKFHFIIVSPLQPCHLTIKYCFKVLMSKSAPEVAYSYWKGEVFKMNNPLCHSRITYCSMFAKRM